jgi:ubiquinone/menaquinone biosynthesis C-methylase UbiE
MDKTALAIQMYDSAAASFAAKFMDLKFYRDSIAAFSELLSGDAKVLDLACGPGNVAKFLAEAHPGIAITGLDLAPAMIELARANVPQAEFQVRDIRDLDFAPASFDAVVAAFALPYLDHAEALKFIADIGRIVKENGLLYLSCMEGPSSRVETMSFAPDSRVWVNYYTEEFLREAFKKNGLAILQPLRQDYPEQDGSITVDMIFILRKVA